MNVLKNKNGISLIMLVITIVVIVILAVAVILSISNNNPIENARKARFLSDLKAIQEEVELYEASKMADAYMKGEKYVATTVSGDQMVQQFPSTENYKEKVKIENGKLSLIEQALSDKEIEWAAENGYITSGGNKNNKKLVDVIKASLSDDNANGLYYHNNLTNSAEDSSYRYSGENPDNYIKFNNEDWRIIGVIPTEVKNSDGTTSTKDLVKIINTNYTYQPESAVTDMSTVKWDRSSTNNWATASYQRWLNSTYLNGLDVDSNYIATAVWKVSGVPSANQTELSAWKAKSFYDSEITNATTTWEGKVGLMYASDYAYAIKPEHWDRSIMFLDGSASASDTNPDHSIPQSNWLWSTAGDKMEWTMTRDSVKYSSWQATNVVYRISDYGAVFPNLSNAATGMPRLGRAVVYLDADLLCTGGNGTASNPYTITKDYGLFNDYYELARNKAKTLSFEQKIRQMLMVFYDSTKTLNAYGSVIFFEKDFTNKEESQVKEMVNSVQNGAPIPVLTAVDEEGKTGSNGVIRVSSNNKLTANNDYLKGNQFPNSQTLYANGGFDLIKTDTIEKSKFLYNLGLNLDLAPVVDICNEGDYMYHRSVGLNAEGTSTFAKTVINASNTAKKNGYGVSYCLKHFPGYGNNSDTHVGFSRDTRTLEQVKKDMTSFEAGIKAGAESVLISHNIVSSVDDDNPASLSPAINSLLRNDLKFTGVIVTDALNMGALDNIEGDKFVKAVLAGNDLLIVTDGNTAYNSINNAVKDGTIKEETINEAATRILAWKYYKNMIK